MYQVLFVDDESIIRNGMEKAVSWNELGYELISTASNGLEALRIVKEKSPDVVIADIKMPVMDGIELCRQLKLNYPNIKTIILSGYSTFEYAKKAIEYNVFSYITKPIQEKEMYQKLKELRFVLESQRSSEADQAVLNVSNHKRNVQNSLYTLIKSTNKDTPEFKDAVEMLLPVLGKESLCVLTCLVENKKNGTQQIDDRRIRSILSDQEPKEMFFVFAGIFLHIVLYKKHMSDSFVLRKAKEIKAKLDKNYYYGGSPADICIGIGGIYTELSNLDKSAEESIYALDYRFFSRNDPIISHKALKRESISGQYIDMAKTAAEIKEAFDSNNTATVMGIVRKTLDLLASSFFKDRNLFYVKVLNFYQLMLANLKEAVPELSVVPEEQMFKTIMQIKDYESLKTEMFSIIQKIYENYLVILSFDRHQQLANRVKGYVSANYAKDLSLASLSNAFHFNPSYLSTIFSETTGSNLSDYILEVRMEHAKKLLKSSSDKIQDVARAVGYIDYRYFCTIFKKYTNFTPLQYRLKQFGASIKD